MDRNKKIGIGVGAGLAAIGIGLMFYKKKPGDDGEPPEPPPPPPEDKANLFGYIMDQDTGDPVTGAQMTLYQDTSPTKTLTFKAVTDNWGHYEMTGLAVCPDNSLGVYAGGYTDYNKENFSIAEGNIQMDFTMKWAGGSRDVPRYISYNLAPVPILSGQLFDAGMVVWLPVVKTMNHRYRVYLRILGENRIETEVSWAILHKALWDSLDPDWRDSKGYIYYENEGNVSLEGQGVAEYEEYSSRGSVLVPIPPGNYTVAYRLVRNYVELSGTHKLTSYSDAHPDSYSVQGEVGTIEIV